MPISKAVMRLITSSTIMRAPLRKHRGHAKGSYALGCSVCEHATRWWWSREIKWAKGGQPIRLRAAPQTPRRLRCRDGNRLASRRIRASNRHNHSRWPSRLVVAAAEDCLSFRQRTVICGLPTRRSGTCCNRSDGDDALVGSVLPRWFIIFRLGSAAARHDDRTEIRCNVRSHVAARSPPSILPLLSVHHWAWW